MALAPQGNCFLTVDSNQVRIWDLQTLKLSYPPVQNPRKSFYRAEISPDGRTLVTTSQGAPFELDGWDFRTAGHLWGPVPLPNAAAATKFNAKGDRFVTTSGLDGDTQLWATDTGKPLGPVIKMLHGNSVALNREGVIAALSGSQGTRLWHLPTGQPLGPILKYGAGSFVSLDDTHVNARAANHAIRSWRLPQPVQGPLDQIVLSSQIATGLHMDLHGNITSLDGVGWQALCKAMKSETQLR